MSTDIRKTIVLNVTKMAQCHMQSFAAINHSSLFILEAVDESDKSESRIFGGRVKTVSPQRNQEAYDRRETRAFTLTPKTLSSTTTGTYVRELFEKEKPPVQY